MERALRIMNDFVAKINEERANERYDRANEYLDMLWGLCAYLMSMNSATAGRFFLARPTIEYGFRYRRCKYERVYRSLLISRRNALQFQVHG